MANRFLTRDEVLLELAIPCMRAAITSAVRTGRDTVPNPAGRDIVPMRFHADLLADGGKAVLDTCDGLEASIRRRISVREWA